MTEGNVILPQPFLFYQRSRGFGGNIPVVLSNYFHALRKLLHTSQGPELGKEMEPGYRMGPMDLDSGTEVHTACGPKSRGWFSHIINGKYFHFCVITLLV